MGTEKPGNGIDRRQFFRKAAVAGAAAAWTAPVLKTIVGTPAFAKSVSGSPNFKDLSYIVVCYTSADNPGQTCCVKWNLDGGSAEVGNFNMPECGGFSGGTCGDPGHFNISGTGSSYTVCLSEAGIAAGCTILSGVAKCGSSQSTSTPCVGGAASGNCLTFSNCGGA